MYIANQGMLSSLASIAFVFASTTFAFSEENGLKLQAHTDSKTASFQAQKQPMTAYEKSEEIRLQSENFFRRVNERSNSAIRSICSGCMADSSAHRDVGHHGFKVRPASYRVTSE